MYSLCPVQEKETTDEGTGLVDSEVANVCARMIDPFVFVSVKRRDFL